MEFTKSTGTVIGATAQMKTKLAGHAIICLIFPTDTGSHYSLYTRAMIVEDLQGPIYLGQDIFQATHIFHSLTPTHMVMSIGKNTYRTPYIHSRRDRPIARLQATGGAEEGNPSVAINHSEDCQTNSIIFNIKQITQIKPNTRRATTITLSPTHKGHLQLPCIIELKPISLSHTHSLEVVPTLNQLHKTGDTEIMIVNDTA